MRTEKSQARSVSEASEGGVTGEILGERKDAGREKKTFRGFR